MDKKGREWHQSQMSPMGRLSSERAERKGIRNSPLKAESSFSKQLRLADHESIHSSQYSS